MLAGSPRTITDRIQRVLNAAARVVSGTRKFDRGLSKLFHSELHWLDIPQRVQYKLGVIVHQCLQNKAPQYLVDCCKCTSDVSSRQRLRSANRCQLIVPRHVAACLVVGLSPSRVRWNGTRFQTLSVTLLGVLTVSPAHPLTTVPSTQFYPHTH